MKKKLYVRVAQTSRSYIADAGFKPNQAPLYKTVWKHGSNQKEYLPTVHFALNVTIPDAAFVEAGSVVGDINLELEKQLGIATEVAELNEDQTND